MTRLHVLNSPAASVPSIALRCYRDDRIARGSFLTSFRMRQNAPDCGHFRVRFLSSFLHKAKAGSVSTGLRPREMCLVRFLCVPNI